MKKKLYEYDIRRGHYYLIEADETNSSTNVTTDTDEKKTENSAQSQETIVNKSVESNPDIQKINGAVEAENKRHANAMSFIENEYNSQKSSLSATLNSALAGAGKVNSTSTYDNVQTNPDVISVKKKLLDLELKFAENKSKEEILYARNINNLENSRLDVLSKMNNEGFRRLPDKYVNFLNESNIHLAKIYINELVANDDEHILKDMNDFKRAFRDSELVYGQDRNGYYTLCIDKEDFNKLYNKLETIGYMRDEIFASVMPQILDRSSMLDLNIK